MRGYDPEALVAGAERAGFGGLNKPLDHVAISQVDPGHMDHSGLTREGAGLRRMVEDIERIGRRPGNAGRIA